MCYTCRPHIMFDHEKLKDSHGEIFNTDTTLIVILQFIAGLRVCFHKHAKMVIDWTQMVKIKWHMVHEGITKY
jgi:hypothetical protein